MRFFSNFFPTLCFLCHKDRKMFVLLLQAIRFHHVYRFKFETAKIRSFTAVCGSRTIAPEENYPPTLTLTLIGGNFPRAQLSGHTSIYIYMYQSFRVSAVTFFLSCVVKFENY